MMSTRAKLEAEIGTITNKEFTWALHKINEKLQKDEIEENAEFYNMMATYIDMYRRAELDDKVCKEEV